MDQQQRLLLLHVHSLKRSSQFQIPIIFLQLKVLLWVEIIYWYLFRFILPSCPKFLDILVTLWLSPKSPSERDYPRCHSNRATHTGAPPPPSQVEPKWNTLQRNSTERTTDKMHVSRRQRSPGNHELHNQPVHCVVCPMIGRGEN